MKKHKPRIPKQTKASTSTPEVFVLPPELLAKLGIKLVNVQPDITPQISQSTSSQDKENEQSVDHSISDHLPDKEDASSIIETASLMKKSVFLSPTFFQTPSVATSYEEGAIADGDNILYEVMPIPLTSSKELTSEINLNNHQITTELANKQNSCVGSLPEQNIVINRNESLKQITNENCANNLTSIDTPYENVVDVSPNDKLAPNVLNDDHADEAYLSDFSNSHSGCSPESIISEKSKIKLKPCKNKDKPDVSCNLQSGNVEVQDMDIISVPSEVVSQPVILESKEATICHNINKDNNSVVAVDEREKATANNGSKIDVSEVKSDAKQIIISKNVQSPKSIAHIQVNKKGKEYFDNANVSTCTNKIDSNNTYKSTRNSNDPVMLQHEIGLVSPVPTDASSSSPTSQRSTEKTQIPETEHTSEDKVKEIAAYLCQIAHERNKKNRRRSKNIVKEIKVDPTVSKLCIQGVEKPGGQDIQREILEVTKVTKTYERPLCRNRVRNKIPKTKSITMIDPFQLTNDKNIDQIKNTEVRALEHQTKFCICFDFGDFSYYDCEMLYEHIHFRLHNDIECDSATIYSIYNEDFNDLKQNVDVIEHGSLNESDDNGAIQNALCWNVINSLDDIGWKESVTNGEKLSTVTNARNSHEMVKDKQIDSVRKDLAEPAEISKTNNINKDGIAKSRINIKTRTNKPDKETKPEKEQDMAIKESPKRVHVHTRNSLNVEIEKINNESPEKSSKDSNKSTTKSITNINSKSSNSVTSNRKSSMNTVPDEPTSNRSRKNNILLPENDTKKMLKNDHDITANTIVTVDTPKSTKTSRFKSLKLKSVENTADLENISDDDLPLKRVAASKALEKNNKNTKAKSPVWSIITDSEKVVFLKSGKRPSNATRTSAPVKKSKRMHSYKDVDKITVTSTEKIFKSRRNKTVKQEEENTDVIKIQSVVTDDELLYEVPVILDYTINEAHTTEQDETTMLDSTIDTTFNVTTLNDTQSIESSASSAMTINDSIKCGICETTVDNQTQWDKHRWQKHSYLAWRIGDTPLDLDDDNALRSHIQTISNKNGGLECPKCNLKRKHAKPFLRHIQTCMQEKSKTDNGEKEVEAFIEIDTSSSTSRKSRDKKKSKFTCGVCEESVEQSDWIEHIRVKHNYLAWTTDEEPLNLKDEVEVKQHLNYLAKYHGGLICNTCGTKWAYVKKFLNHSCEIKEKELIVPKEVKLDIPDVVTCGICNLDIQGRDWIKHIQVAHEYMAWYKGQPPLDEENNEAVKAHLDVITKAAGELICTRCGERRRHTHAYLQHRAACELTGFDMNLHVGLQPEPPVDPNHFVCGVCHESGEISKWKEHAMAKHYNIAWKVGEVPINLRNPYAVEKYLKVYKKKRGLTCLSCNETRTSCYGFYAHILTCGRTPEEIDGVMNECELCHNKYLCIYRNQHMAWHRDSDMRREKRELKAMEECHKKPEPAPAHPMGKRRAAEKAKNVIKDHSMTMVDGKPECGCGMLFQNEEEYAAHSCSKKASDGNDSDGSVKIEEDSYASDDYDDTYLSDQNLSDEEEDDLPKKRKRTRPESTKIQRLRYKVENYGAYLGEAYKDFVTIHYTSESLFNIWRNSEYTIVPTEERDKYLPQVIESCNVKIGKLEPIWTTYKRFEATKLAFCTSLFTGGAIQCISWVPAIQSDDSLGCFLAVASHRGPDVPRHGANELPVHPGSLQIWDFGRFDTSPYCALCIAHEYGIVWAMDWCPSGARDGPQPAVPQECRAETTQPRLGLLAIACSNGSVYVLAVPVPPATENELEPPMYKLKPVAELRLTMSPERRVYQATSVRWSPQKGHSVIIAGYSDGSTAQFDLNTESPFLAATEKGVTVYYPFQDRRVESSSITSVGVFATTAESCAVGGQFSTSMTGGTLMGRTARPTARSHLAISGALQSPNWPAVALSGDLPFMRSGSEMEWWGGGRRIGVARAWAACAKCARTASAAQPAVRLHHHHPIYPEIKKLIGAVLMMVPLHKKAKRKEPDDMSVVVEPLTYDEAAAKYGLHLYTVARKRSEQALAQQLCIKEEFQPERFPLADVVAMAFCPATRYHDRLAVASHTGFVFIIHA